VLITFLLGLAVVAGMGAAVFAWQATAPYRDRRRAHRDRVRAWRRELAGLDSRAVDALPRTGGPPEPDQP